MFVQAFQLFIYSLYVMVLFLKKPFKLVSSTDSHKTFLTPVALGTMIFKEYHYRKSSTLSVDKLSAIVSA